MILLLSLTAKTWTFKSEAQRSNKNSIYFILLNGNITNQQRVYWYSNIIIIILEFHIMCSTITHELCVYVSMCISLKIPLRCIPPCVRPIIQLQSLLSAHNLLDEGMMFPWWYWKGLNKIFDLLGLKSDKLDINISGENMIALPFAIFRCVSMKECGKY